MDDKLKPGDYVMMVNCPEATKNKGKIWRVRSDPWKLGHGEEVVLLEGMAGGFATKYLLKMNN